MAFRTRALPVLVVVAAAAVPLVRHVREVRAERVGADVARLVVEAQWWFRAAGTGYATRLASLTTPCPGVARAALDASVIARGVAAGYEVTLRAAEGASWRGPDCHGHPTAENFHLGVQPRAPAPPRLAFGATAQGGIFLFVDGIAPRERDMEPGGLAVPIDADGAFRIP
jgi:hypothetical protein